MKWYIVIIIILITLKSPYVKGLIGEFIVAVLLKFLNKDIYRVYHDLYIEKENGTTSQIDHVITSPFGIFVVETKNYKGWIFGSEKASFWTQVIYRTKNKFHNPIIQNKGHIKHLSNYLGYTNQTKYHSIIAFTGRATLKKIDTITPVLYTIRLVPKIKKFKEIIIEPEKLMEINDKLSSLGRVNWKTRRQHVKDIKSGKSFQRAKAVKQVEESIELDSIVTSIDICPICGNELILKSTKSEQLYGCSEYPKCQFTKEVGSVQKPLSQTSISNTSYQNTYGKRNVIDELRSFNLSSIHFLVVLYITLGIWASQNLSAILFHLIGGLILFRYRPKSTRKWFEAALAIFIIAIFLGNWLNSYLVLDHQKDDRIVNNSVSVPKTGSNAQLPTTKQAVLTIPISNENSADTDSEIAANEDQPVDSSSKDTETSVSENTESVIIAEDASTETSSINSELSTVVLGMKQEDVIRMIGTPDKIENSRLKYGDSSILVNSAEEVIGWYNFHNVLNQFLPQQSETPKPFFLGSSKEDVQVALGAPPLLDQDSEYHWSYSNSSVWFDANGQVVGWHNLYSKLNNGMVIPIADAPAFFIGSTKEEVISALGAPTLIDYKNPYQWRYGSAYVLFDESYQVIGWSNQNDYLSVGMVPKNENSEEFFYGSTKEEVLEVMGAPTIVDANEPQKWRWSSAYVLFGDDDTVIGWSNSNQDLVGLRSKKVTAADINIGSTIDQVLDALGAPTLFTTSDLYKWRYGYAYVTFDEFGRVNGWYSYNDEFKNDLMVALPGADEFSLGSTKEEVLDAQGAPLKIDSGIPNKWIWGNAYVVFNSDWKVVEVNDYNNYLRYIE